jgi:hypothetical protein
VAPPPPPHTAVTVCQMKPLTLEGGSDFGGAVGFVGGRLGDFVVWWLSSGLTKVSPHVSS